MDVSNSPLLLVFELIVLGLYEMEFGYYLYVLHPKHKND